MPVGREGGCTGAGSRWGGSGIRPWFWLAWWAMS